MKHLIITGILAVSTSVVSAQTFDFQRQFSSTEYDYTVGTEGIAYRAYHERYAPDTDWGVVAREFRSQSMGGELASGAGLKGHNS